MISLTNNTSASNTYVFRNMPICFLTSIYLSLFLLFPYADIAFYNLKLGGKLLLLYWNHQKGLLMFWNYVSWH